MKTLYCLTKHKIPSGIIGQSSIGKSLYPRRHLVYVLNIGPCINWKTFRNCAGLVAAVGAVNIS